MFNRSYCLSAIRLKSKIGLRFFFFQAPELGSRNFIECDVGWHISEAVGIETSP